MKFIESIVIFSEKQNKRTKATSVDISGDNHFVLVTRQLYLFSWKPEKVEFSRVVPSNGEKNIVFTSSA